jgi:hypothetical protein
MTETGIRNKVADYGKQVKRIGADNRMLATHISLLSALFACWQQSGFKNPVAVTRKKLMAISRIASIATYHKCIRELDEFGYIRYQPSYHPIKGSLVWWPLSLSGPPDKKKEPGNPGGT